MTERVESCSTCYFFQDFESHSLSGQCRIRSPIVMYGIGSCWPVVEPQQWCGEWKHKDWMKRREQSQDADRWQWSLDHMVRNAIDRGFSISEATKEFCSKNPHPIFGAKYGVE